MEGRYTRRVLVAYATHLGATKGIAEHIGAVLRARGLEVEIVAAESARTSVARDFDAYVIGSAVHGGHWLPAARSLIEDTAAAMAGRPVWLFSSGPIGERYVHLEQPEPKEIEGIRRMLDVRDHVVFAGAFRRATAELNRLGWLERNLVGRFMPEGDFRDWDAIAAWAGTIASELVRRAPVAAGKEV